MHELQHRKGSNTRDRILDVAEAAILEKGFAATSIDELTAAVGITTQYGTGPSRSGLCQRSFRFLQTHCVTQGFQTNRSIRKCQSRTAALRQKTSFGN